MGVQLKDLIEPKEVKLEHLKGKILAVDASMWLYQFISSIRARDGSLLTNSEGRVTSHLIGLSSRIPKLMQAGIRLVFVFDGAPPELKTEEREKRKKAKIKAEEQLHTAKEEEDIELIKKYSAMTSRLTKEMIDDAVELLDAFGIPSVFAESEAEAQASYMVKKGEAYALASNDYDSLLFGAPKIVRNLNIIGKRKKARTSKYITIKPELLTLSEVLNQLGIDQEQLIILGMLVGTDFNTGGIKGIGPKTALKLVKKFKSDYEELFKEVEWNKHFDVSWTEVFYLIKNMPVKKSYNIKFKEVDEKKLRIILVDKNDFSEERVEKIISKFSKIKNQKQQKGLGDWV